MPMTGRPECTGGDAHVHWGSPVAEMYLTLVDEDYCDVGLPVHVHSRLLPQQIILPIPRLMAMQGLRSACVCLG